MKEFIISLLGTAIVEIYYIVIVIEYLLAGDFIIPCIGAIGAVLFGFVGCLCIKRTYEEWRNNNDRK